MKIKEYEGKIEIPEGIEVKIEEGIITVSNKDKELSRQLKHKKVSLSVVDKNVVISFKNGTKREKTMSGTFKAHIKNMFKGVTEGHIYKLKICSGHFPMNVTMKENKFIVNNFLGEKTPRELNLKDGADVKIEGDIVTISGIDKELAAQTAADIEILTKIKGKDLRIFQDGIYITEKDGKMV
ncbi:50S ribosomal protein L6 [Candidatus Woesearchaeota archaeon B3_Woes]|nr:MAG: 50S ribosomal protein L6 [Candidatus Woesearchaeota archaeon B3_Woes]